MEKGVIVLILVCGLASFSQACFPPKYWISCLIDTCKLGGTCPGDPAAKCRMDRTECNGCAAVWEHQYGNKKVRANCSATQDLDLCPGGEPVVHCKMDPCQWTCDHPKYINAPCQKNYCGKCMAEYLIEGKWRQCPYTSPSDAGSLLPVDTVLNPQRVIGQCIMQPCSINICMGETCPAVQNAVCRPYPCGSCRPMWYLDNMPVDCKTGEFIKGLPEPHLPIVKPPGFQDLQRTCKPGEPYVPCDQSVCNGQICRNYPNAVCRADGCGKCKPTWYLDDKLVDCLSDECPPNVPFVRCVDDPCKYFSHYCPTAECRASQCGKCEAKFFVNGNEIDCVMPPKPCETGVDALTCPWFTCPANICPANTRLMCRINPCGRKCGHEWVDIYNGEIRTCRTFERPGKPGKSGKTKKYKPPKSNRIFYKDPIMHILDPNPADGPIYEERKQSMSKFQPKEITTSTLPNDNIPSLPVANMKPSGNFGPNEVGGFRVEPVFINPGPPIQDVDLLSLLRSFKHEIKYIRSESIRKALKKPLPEINEFSGPMPQTQPTTFVQPEPTRNFVRSNLAPQSTQIKQTKRVQPVIPDDPILPVQSAPMPPMVHTPMQIVPPQPKPTTQMQPVVPDAPLMPVQSAPFPPLVPSPMQMIPPEPKPSKVIELKHNDPVPTPQGIRPTQESLEKAAALLVELSNQAMASNLNLGPGPVTGLVPKSPQQPASKPLFPEMAHLAQNSALPSGILNNQEFLPEPQGINIPKKLKPKKTTNMVSQNNGGVPISMNLFNQWSAIP